MAIQLPYIVMPGFETRLNEQIREGQANRSLDTSNINKFIEARNIFIAWDDFNNELLKRAFNAPDNEYFLAYKSPIPDAAPYRSNMLYSSVNTLNWMQGAAVLNRAYFIKLERLILIKNKLPLISLERDIKSQNSNIESGFGKLSNLLINFHKVALHLEDRYDKRTSLVIKDEYDVQDLLFALLQLSFQDIRKEDSVPSYAGSNSRVDFVLKKEKIVLETKMTSTALSEKMVGEQILVDIGRYKNHKDCKTLVVFVYDKLGKIKNKNGFISDLESLSSDTLLIKVFVKPD